jgi:hypothetical protein
MTRDNFLTPQELMHSYPQVKRLGWNSAKIGVFFSSGMLQGYCCVKERRSMILESSFLELMDYVDTVTAKKRLRK